MDGEEVGEIEERIEGITERVKRRNERLGMVNARRRLRAMRVGAWNSWRMRWLG